MNLSYMLINIELQQMSRYLDFVQRMLERNFEEVDKIYQEQIAEDLTEDYLAVLEDPLYGCPYRSRPGLPPTSAIEFHHYLVFLC
jgi:hypothetical protein